MKGFYLFIANLVLAIFITGNIYADTTYVSKKGDSTHKIAKKFKVSRQAVIKANNLKSEKIKPGTRLTIPSGEIETPAKERFAKTKLSKNKREKDTKIVHDTDSPVRHQEDSSFHVVKKGDTLLSISKKYSISVNELREINDIRSKKLKIGQKLVVSKGTLKDYTVRKGDTIWDIAKRLNVDPDELMEINRIEANSLKPGQKILLAAEAEPNEAKTYDAVISHANIEEEIEKISESKDGSDLGLQDKLIVFARKLLNIPYRFGGNSLFGIDCSAYVKKVYSLIGVDLPRSAREQFHEGKPVDGEELSIGDLVFFRTYASFPSHVGIYLGNNLFIHASSRSKKVTIDSLDTPYYFKRFIGAKRLLDVKDEKVDPQKEG
jgi:peptidoglycan endopeptidase LytE